MQELTRSGLPLFLDETDYVMHADPPLKVDGCSRKDAASMRGLLSDERNLPLAEAFYDVYRGIAFPEDEKLFGEHDIRYDITIIMPGQVNGECKKTSGHYHGWDKSRANTYAEVYEVLAGTAMYVLQRSDNFDAADPADVKVDDLILATVHEGETIIIPPNYGHCSVNIGDGPLVFSNLAYVPCPVNYEPVRYFHGMSFYVMKEGAEVRLKMNDRYGKAPQPKFAAVREAPALGIKFGRPAYESYKEDPAAFRFLEDPDDYVDEIMSLLIYSER